MRNDFERFDPTIVERDVMCGNCRACRQPGYLVFDEYTEQYYCDTECLTEDLHEHIDDVIAFYTSLNIYE